MTATEAKKTIKEVLINNNVAFRELQLDSEWKYTLQEYKVLDGIFQNPNTKKHWCVNVNLNNDIVHFEELDW